MSIMNPRDRTHETPRCYRCKWLFHLPPEQPNRVFCLACSSRARAEWRAVTARGDMLPWEQIGAFLSGADEATAVQRTAELPRGQSAGGGMTPVESPQFLGGIDDMEW